MGKQETIDSQKQALAQAQDAALDSALGNVWDESALEQKASDGTLTQGDLDAAVKAATDPLNAQIADDAQKLSAAIASAQADHDSLQKSLDDMTAKEQLEEKVVSDLQNAVGQVQASLDAIKALVLPQPVSSP